jgi:conjugal transfer pilus assembly protein TrbC
MRTCSIFLFSLFLMSCYAEESEDWFTKAQQINEESIEWLKTHLQEKLINGNLFKNHLEPEISAKKGQCTSNVAPVEESHSLYVFMSFSLEDHLWVQFSKELEKMGGIFVLRGLPNNSFKEFADRIFELQQQGVKVSIQIHPKLFEECDIQLVPTILVKEENSYDKISGNISLGCALEAMSIKGETESAKTLFQQWIALEKK